MVGIFIATALLVASETEDLVDSNMNLRRKRTPRASQHYVGWRAGQKSVLLPVAGEFFPLTLPFIERGNRTSSVPRVADEDDRGAGNSYSATRFPVSLSSVT